MKSNKGVINDQTGHKAMLKLGIKAGSYWWVQFSCYGNTSHTKKTWCKRKWDLLSLEKILVSFWLERKQNEKTPASTY